jgi:hypothetical protein
VGHVIVGIHEAGEDVRVGDSDACRARRIGAARRHTYDLVAFNDQFVVNDLFRRDDLALDDLVRSVPTVTVVAAHEGLARNSQEPHDPAGDKLHSEWPSGLVQQSVSV